MTEYATGSALTETILDVIGFVTNVVLPMLRDYESFGDIRFRLRDDPSFNASILPLGTDRFVVYINSGVADELFALLARGTERESSLTSEHLAECERAGLDVDAALTLSFVGALVFFLLHEVFHALAGHVAYCNASLARPVGTVSPDSEISNMLELEADGAAWETTLGFTGEIFATVTDSAPLPPTASAAVDRAIMLGALSGLAMLDALPDRVHEQQVDYPFPGVRVLNACSASFRAMTRGSGDPERTSGARVDRDAIDAETLLGRYRESVVPAVLLVDELLAARYGATPFLQRGARDDDDPLTLLCQDISMVLGGGRPDRSPAGRALVRLADERSLFAERLAPYRRIDLW